MKYLHFNEVNSTNDYLKAHYFTLPSWTIVTADYQSKGHGRLLREWNSKKKENLLVSLLIKDKKTLSNISSLSLLTGVAVYKLLKELGLNNVKIKWPNDVYVNNKKMAGILLESKSSGDNLKAIIIGVGINLNQIKFPNKILATSYCLIKRKKISINKVNKAFIKILKNEINLLNKKQSNYLKIINANNYLKNKTGYAIKDNKKIKVQFKDIDKDNNLIAIYQKKKIKISTNEVTLKL